MGRRALIALAATAALAAAFAAGFVLHSQAVTAPAPAAAPAQPLRALVLDELRHHYYLNVPERAGQATTMRGVLRELDDPYTRYLSPSQYRELVEMQAGGYAGIGLALGDDPRGLVVQASIPGLPAREAGIRPGDVITTVNDTDLRQVSYLDAVDMMHGAPGSPVKLEILRQGIADPLLLTLERQPVTLTRVTSHTIGSGSRAVVVIRVPAFSEGTARAVRRSVQAAHARGAQAVVLDVRGNLGGLLSEAVGVARVFIDQGVIVGTAGVHEPGQLLVADGTAVRSPRVVVLTDGTTASAAEVMAGALQQAHLRPRAVVVGSRSFGKGTVQAVHPLPGGGALKLTVAMLRLADGTPLDGVGVIPDIPAVDRPATDVDEVIQAVLRLLGR
jgi:carboxyl-terminal processing protease